MRLNIDTDSLAPTEIVEECARIILRRVFVRIKNSESCERPLAETEVGGSATKNMFMKQWLGKIMTRKIDGIHYGWVRKRYMYVVFCFFLLKKNELRLAFQSAAVQSKLAIVQSSVQCLFLSILWMNAQNVARLVIISFFLSLHLLFSSCQCCLFNVTSRAFCIFHVSVTVIAFSGCAQPQPKVCPIKSVLWSGVILQFKQAHSAFYLHSISFFKTM